MKKMKRAAPDQSPSHRMDQVSQVIKIRDAEALTDSLIGGLCTKLFGAYATSNERRAIFV